MKKKCVVISTNHNLDDRKVRQSVIRIPEVIHYLNMAEKVWAQSGAAPYSFINLLAGDEEMFFKSIKLKSLLAAIIQVALFKRYVAKSNQPEFIVGDREGESAALVCAGQKTFRQLILNSRAFDEALDIEVSEDQEVHKTGGRLLKLPMAKPLQSLVGSRLSSYSVFERVHAGEMESYRSVQKVDMDIKNIISYLMDEESVRSFVTVGPGGGFLSSIYQEKAMMGMQVLDSIETDPMLNWFWGSVRSSDLDNKENADSTSPAVVF